MNETQRLTTTLNRLRAAGACKERYEYLVRALGGTEFDHDAPINLLTILGHNGTNDCLWALCATDKNCDVIARLMAADFAEAVLPIFERRYPKDRRPRRAIAVAWAFARGEITAAAETVGTAAVAAWKAAWKADSKVVRAAAASAAASASAVSGPIAGEAALAAAVASPAAAAGQAEIIRRYLLPDEETKESEVIETMRGSHAIGCLCPTCASTPPPSGARQEAERGDRADFNGDYFADQRYQDYVLEEHSRREVEQPVCPGCTEANGTDGWAVVRHDPPLCKTNAEDRTEKRREEQ